MTWFECNITAPRENLGTEMQFSLLAATLLLCFACEIHAASKIKLAAKERQRLINEAVSEAKLHASLRKQSAKDFLARTNDRELTADQILNRGFKYGGPLANKIGNSRLLLEDVVNRAEFKISEASRKINKAETAEEEAEQLADEIYHTPGTILTKEELKEIMEIEEIHCPLTIPNCNSPLNLQFRSISGVCNNFRNPLLGSAGTAFRRLVPAEYEDGISAPRGRRQSRRQPFNPPNPSARIISKRIVSPSNANENPFTHILMQWGQFLDHDITLAPEPEGVKCDGCAITDVCEPIRVPRNDRVFGRGTLRNAECLPLRRSIPACESRVNPGLLRPREQLNSLTAFIDGSMIYGSDLELEEALRGNAPRGQLLQGPPVFRGGRATLPYASGEVKERFPCPNCDNRFPECFMAGDIRVNEQVSLTTLHTIFLREHNRLAPELANINPHWSDERLFQESRKILGAIIQKITYTDYLPKILGRPTFDQLIGEYNGYNRNVDPSISNVFATAAFRYGHSLVQPFFERLNSNFERFPNIPPLPLFQAFFNISAFIDGLGTDPLIRGLTRDLSRRVDEFVNFDLTNRLMEMANCPGSGLDLISLNLQRGREHGIPPYIQIRDFCQRTFPNLPRAEFENRRTLAEILNVYGSLDTLDVWLGALAEERLPQSLLGPTLACLFGITFRDLRDGDRFYYLRPGVFTRQQVREIHRSSLSRIICDGGDRITAMQADAFLQNQPLSNCNSLPRVDLRAWREVPCFARVLAGPSSPGNAVVFAGTNRRFNALPIDNSRPICISIACPGERSRLHVFANNRRNQQCSVQARPQLPASQSRTPGIYSAIISQSVLDSNLGLYRSLGACEAAGSRAAFRVSCTGAVEATENIDDDSENKKAGYVPDSSDCCGMDCGSPENKCNHVSDDMFKTLMELDEEDQETGPTNFALENENLVDESLENTKEKLLQELEESLEKLNKKDDN